MIKKVVYVQSETHKELMLLKISCKAKDLEEVIRKLIDNYNKYFDMEKGY